MILQMMRVSLHRRVAGLFFVLGIPAMLLAQTVGVFFDAAAPQESFAAGDVRDALVSKGFTVEMLALSSLSSGYANRKVVIALQSNTAVTSVLTAQGGTNPGSLGEQAYALSTTTTPQVSYWVLGGDATGAMYGGFQVTENIKFDGYGGTMSKQEAPFMKERGEKLNMPFDKRSGTYNYDAVTSSSVYQAIRNVWDFNFWKEYFDQMARYRYNMVTIWSNSPFTAMTTVADYPLAALQNVQDSAGTVILTMTIQEKIAHWQRVMAYAKSRGFKFYLFVWSTYLGSAQKVYPALSEGGSTDPETMDFLYKSMTALLASYPDLDGFGVTGGENMSGSDAQKGNFFWQSYVKAMTECLQNNPSRKLTFIQRFHQTSISAVTPSYAQFRAQPNARYLTSFKYARCTMYSVGVPTTWQAEGGLSACTNLKLRTFHTIRNDDLFFLHWGDPAFARVFINGLPSPATFTEGIYIGSDGFSPTRCFHVKDQLYKNDLEINRLWYRQMIWGRISYSPNTTPDQVFKNYLHLHYPGINENVLFTAWTNASRAFDVGNEFIRGSYLNDYMYYPEGQISSSGYINVGSFATASPNRGSTLTNGGVVADSVKKMGLLAINAINSINPATAGNARAIEELTINLKNLKALACLAVYVGEKIRGAKNTAIRANALKDGYCFFNKYTDLMNQMHVGQQFTRVVDILPTWLSLNTNPLNEAGGTPPTNCPNLDQTGAAAPVVKSKIEPMGIRALSTRAITLFLPNEKGFTFEIFAGNGAKVAQLSKRENNKGVSRFVLDKKLPHGLYMVRLRSGDQTANLKVNVCCD